MSEKLRFELLCKSTYHPIFGWKQDEEIEAAYNQVRNEIING